MSVPFSMFRVICVSMLKRRTYPSYSHQWDFPLHSCTRYMKHNILSVIAVVMFFVSAWLSALSSCGEMGIRRVKWAGAFTLRTVFSAFRPRGRHVWPPPSTDSSSMLSFPAHAGSRIVGVLVSPPSCSSPSRPLERLRQGG